MNKYQEALEYFLLWINPSSEEFDYDNYLKHRKALKELIDKETPMKPIVYNINQYKCPKCLKQIKGKKMIYNSETKRFDIISKIKVEKNYCPYCSTKLDWSDYGG